MRAILAAITITGLLAGMAHAGAPRSFHKRKVEKARDARLAAEAAGKPAPAPAASGPSDLARVNKPPSSRFFSRVRTAASRKKAKAELDAAKAAAAAAPPRVGPAEPKNLIYRRTTGARSKHRVR